MAWHEPAQSNKSNKIHTKANMLLGRLLRVQPTEPPDLGEIFKKMQQNIERLFSHQSSNNTSNRNSLSANFKVLWLFIVVGIVLIWFFSGFFIVDPAEKAVVLSLGKYADTKEPGLHWIPSFINTRYLFNVQQIKTYPYQAEMLTQDENIVSVDLVVQYRIQHLKEYLFSVQNPEESLQQATASALRQVIGQTTLDNVLTSGREKVRQDTLAVLEKILKPYHTGLMITDINMQPVKPPEEVTAAFDDAIKAREDEQRFKNQAMTYANRSIPVAVGQASRLLAEADAYQQQIVLAAEGEVAQFLALLPQYHLTPQVTRQRMYIDTLQAVLSRSAKVLTDTPSSNNLMYLPIDKLMQKTENRSVNKNAEKKIPDNNLDNRTAGIHSDNYVPKADRPSYVTPYNTQSWEKRAEEQQ